MKFVIDVDDFYLEEDELSEALTMQVKNSVIRQIEDRIKDRVEAAITTRVKAVVDEKIAKIIDAKLSECVNSGMIVVSQKEISIVDHVKSVFQGNHGWSNPRDQIQRIADAFGKELKTRYDAIFANRIVVAIKEQGMLKDEVVQLLLK